ncbi:hypothetical protein [Desulfonatronum thiodismutans]|uniref:hypothetical protein n=1 Tax=Desulfonatronum thiodismutans TaxID=159290 RepID=UPI0004ABDAD9|nr:hypothetical protein [Desulfonatronum thiodismutans]
MNKLRATIGFSMAGFLLIAVTVAVSTKAVGEALDGAALVKERCTQCHDLMRVERRAGQDRAWWERTVERMEGKRTGLLNDAERNAVLDHLADM